MSVHEPPVWTPAPQGHSPEESSALTRITWFGIVSLAGVVTSWVVGSYAMATMFNQSAIAALGPNPTPAQTADALGPMFQAIGAMVPVTIAIEVVGMIFLALGFRVLKRVDAARFTTPSAMMVVLIAGTLIAGMGIMPLFNGLPAILAQVPSAPTSTPPAGLAYALGNVIPYALIVGIGGLLALIGLIGGLILGLWRVGSLYEEVLFKIGAVFVIIPFLDIVAPILVLVAARQAKGRLPGAK